jgi:hypothetical protein
MYRLWNDGYCTVIAIFISYWDQGTASTVTYFINSLLHWYPENYRYFDQTDQFSQKHQKMESSTTEPLQTGARATPISTEANAATDGDGGGDTTSLRFQLDRAAVRIYQTKEASEKLFAQWRSSLLRLSVFVILLTFVQAQNPIMDCMKQIKVREKMSYITLKTNKRESNTLFFYY